jgi:hypothetical protein
MERAANCCERCGQSVLDIPASIHHRQARGMGGTRNAATNKPWNLVLLCGTGTTGCHGWVESNRAEAKKTGWLVSKWEAPETVPMADAYGQRFLLDEDWRVEL